MVEIPLAVSYRGGRIEGVHHGSIAVTDPSGKLLYGVNDPLYKTYLRSSIKMIQALPVVLSGAVDTFGFTDAELAICCASHNGAPYHIETVTGMLRKLGLSESALGCGAHDPHNREELGKLFCEGRNPSQLHNNCSGKHTGMLAACLAKGWPIENYLAPEHPLQEWILDLIAEYSGVDRNDIGTATDGCSLPTFFMPLVGAATIAARFTAQAIVEGTPSQRIMKAVAAHPEMINEIGGFDTELIRVMEGRGIAKRGAMAIFLVGAMTESHGPVGVAFKLDEGDMTSMPPVVMRALEGIGALSAEESDELERFRTIRLKNWNGIEVGEIRAEFDITEHGF
jgi:L-asparaginase II